MEKTYKYRFSRRAIYWTLVYLVVFVLLGWLLYHLYEGGYLSAWFTSFIVALIALMSLSIPRRIVVTDEKVEVRCLLDITEIRRDEIASVRRVDPRRMKWFFPVFGGCGFFGYYGHFLDLRRFERVKLYASEWKNFVEITDIYEDLARHSSFSGILFHDDAVLTDFEDVSPEAVAAWRQTGMAHDAAPVPQRPQERQAWMRFKSQTLTRFTLDLRQAVQAIRGPQVKTARNLFALPILEPQSEAWFAQNLDDFLAAYDWTVPMAMPLMESVPIDASQAWLTRLVQAVARHPGALKKTIFELQARDWNRRQQNAIPDQQLADWMRLLRLNGVKNYGYYPDDFINNQPDISRIRPQFSSWWYPDHD